MTTTLTVHQARLLHVAELRARSGDPTAAHQLELRARGTSLVLGALRALGYCYSGTSGWWITAYTTPEYRLGFVNIAKGIAVETDGVLDAEVVEALTVPDQPAGPLASGAVAWTSPDAGEGRRASAPDGWTQLVVDVRQSVQGATVADVACTARVVRWGLATCYQGERGGPGATCLDPAVGDAGMLPQHWPDAAGTRQVASDVAERWLRKWALALAQLAGVEAEVRAAMDASPRSAEPAIKAVGAYAWRPSASMSAAERECRSTLGHGVNPVIRDLLRAARIGRISAGWERARASGDRLYDLIAYLLERILVARTTPTVEAFLEQITPLMESESWHAMNRAGVYETIRAIAHPIGVQVLRGCDADAAEREIVDAYYAGAPAKVSIAHERSEVRS